LSEFKDQWSQEMALEVLASENVDAGLWSEAVRWLLLYGPAELRDLLGEAANTAVAQCFPGVRPRGYDQAGQPYYDLKELAAAQGVPVEEVAESLARLQETVGLELLVAGGRVYRVN